MPTLKLSLLGPPHVAIDDSSVELKPRKAFALLIYLAVAGEYQTRDHLATLFWPETSQREARAALRRRLSELSGALGERWLEIERESVRLRANSALWVDVRHFGQRVQQWQAHGHAATELCPACLEVLTEAVALYRDDFLSGFNLPDAPAFDEWHFFETEKLRHAQSRALEALAQWHGAQGDAAAALPYGRAWLALDPLHEPAHRHLMQLYARLGQRAAALRQYEECRRLLAEELGVMPDESTQSLYAELKASARSAAPLATAPQPITPPALPLAESTSGEVPTRFVGRGRELDALALALASAQRGEGQVRFVIGEAGLGKTTLVQEFARQAQALNEQLLVIAGQCNAYTGVGDPYLPFREALAMLAGEVEAKSAGGWLRPAHVQRLQAAWPVTLPALVDHAPELINSFVPVHGLLARASGVASPAAPWVKQLATLGARGQSVGLDERRIFAQYTAALKAVAARHPLLLVLEDLHWIDLASSALLFHLARAIGDSPILIVGTYRPDEVAMAAGREAHPLAGMVAEFKRQHGDIWLDLGDTTSQEGRDFVNAYVDTEPNRLDVEFRAALFQHTGGHALFTAELLRSMVARGELRQDAEQRWVANQELDWRSLPAKVEGVIERQLARLDNAARAILHVACVQGESFTAEVIARVLQIGEPTLVQLLSQELGRHQRLVGAQELTSVGGQRLSHYRFRHYLFQRYLYQSLDETERAYLHEAVGNALEAIYGEEAATIAVPLAHHFRQAGLVEKAVGALLLAGQRAQQLAAHQEAIQHLSQGLAMLRALPHSSARDRQELDYLIALGAAMDTAGNVDHAEIEKIFLRARDLCHQLGEKQKLWPVLSGLFWTHFYRGQHFQARRYGEEMLQISRDEPDPEPRLIANLMLGGEAICFGDFVASLPYLEEAHTLLEFVVQHGLALRFNNYDIEIDVLGDFAQAKWLTGYADQARQYLESALQKATEVGSPFILGQGLLSVVWQLELQREAAQTREMAEALIRLAAEHDYHLMTSHAYMYEGSAMIWQGEAEAGLARLLEGLSALRAGGNLMAQSHFAYLQVQGYAALGQSQAGIEIIDAALAAEEQSGELWFDAELHRLKGELLLMQGEVVETVEGYYEKAIEIARRQQAKMWELRATVSLCRLWQAQGKRTAAHARLAEIYSWFTEGFGTPDLLEAKALLDALA